MPADPGLGAAGVRDVLSRGELLVRGRLVDASNATLLCQATLDGVELDCVYKPRAGERPLWDFPTGTLSRREVAAYDVSAAAGWDLVPPTLWREDAPAGPGMVQAWIDVADGPGPVDVVDRGAVPAGWRDVVDAEGPGGRPVSLVHADSPALRRMAVFDAVVNNADRKGGHVLLDGDGRVWGIDHGVTFNEDDKLRTVLWGWAGDPLDPYLVDELVVLLDRLDGPLGPRLALALSPAEMAGTRDRVHRLLGRAVFPYPGEGWPPLPWPAF
jgi:uncharacterized repeat protein (TIGR03843 family)